MEDVSNALVELICLLAESIEGGDGGVLRLCKGRKGISGIGQDTSAPKFTIYGNRFLPVGGVDLYGEILSLL